MRGHATSLPDITDPWRADGTVPPRTSIAPAVVAGASKRHTQTHKSTDQRPDANPHNRPDTSPSWTLISLPPSAPPTRSGTAPTIAPNCPIASAMRRTFAIRS